MCVFMFPCFGTRHLYWECGEAGLQWEGRRQLLLREMAESRADVSQTLTASSLGENVLTSSVDTVSARGRGRALLQLVPAQTLTTRSAYTSLTLSH